MSTARLHVQDPLEPQAASASLRVLIDTIADGVVIIDAAGRIRVFNPACERLFGYRADEVVGRNVSMLMSEPERARRGGDLPNDRRAGERGVIGIGREAVGLRKDGSTFPIELSVGETHTAEGDAYVGIIRDITERKRTENAIAWRTRRLAILSDISARLLAAGDPDIEVLPPLFESMAAFGVDTLYSYAATDDGRLRLAFHAGVPEAQIGQVEMLVQGQLVSGRVATERSAAQFSQIQSSDDPRLAFVRSIGMRAFACEPLMAGPHLLGTLSFGSRSRDSFDEDDIAFFRAVAHLVAIARDRVRTEGALLRSRARLRNAMAAGRLGAWEREIGTNRMQSSAQHKANFGLAADAEFTYEMARAMRHPDDREKMDAAFRRAVEEGVPYDVETRVIWPDGSCHWMMARGDIVPGEAGGPARMAGFTLDITERKQAEARLKLLAQEVDHRANNLLAVIQAVVRLTRADTVPGFVDAVQGRLVALARAHKLMADSRWTGADLATLVDEEMAAYRAGDEARIRTRGPAVAMSASAAQSVAMAIHELATNAVKYGALSVEEGRVEITWAWSDAAGLALRWRETGGPPVAPPACRGFGTGVIDGTIRQQLKGAMQFDWRREGLFCEMTVPVESISPRRES